jgi:hypothetical protein
LKQAYYSKTSIPILSILDTFEFIRDLDFALVNCDTKKLYETFKKANLLNHYETKDFLAMGNYIFNKYNNSVENIELINVQDRISKCIACSFGKTVKAYDARYKKKESSISVIYTSSFAINLEINNGELVDFGWCNAFLNKKEINELKS